MSRNKFSRLALPVALAAVVILVAGGAAVASNMAFKLNQPLVLAGAGAIGDNWTSIPYFNPYTTGCTGAAAGKSCFGGLCTVLGLPTSTGLTMFNADTPAAAIGPVLCLALATANGIEIPSSPQARAVRIKGPATPASIIIVGSHNPSITQTLYPTDGPIPNGHNWWSVPYHTTAVTFNDICDQIGLPAAATIFQRNPVNGAGIGPFTCLLNPATPLVLGRGIRILNGSATTPTVFTPAHF